MHLGEKHWDTGRPGREKTFAGPRGDRVDKEEKTD